MIGKALYEEYCNEYPLIMGCREVSYESWLERQVLELRENVINKNRNIMTKEEAKEILKEKQVELRQAEIMIETHENGIREVKEYIEKLKAFINKKEDWRGRGISKDEYVLLTEKVGIMQEMHSFAHVRNNGWLPDWGNECQKKYGILSRGAVVKVDYLIGYNSLIFGIAVKSREIAEEMLEEFGERLEGIYNKQY